MLRKSNLVPDSHPKFNPFEQLIRGNVAVDWNAQLLMVNLEWSKTDPHRQFGKWVPVAPAKNKCICPIWHMAMMFEVIPAQEHDPAFCYYNSKNVLKALTYDQLRKQLKKWAAMCGYSEEDHKFTPHCLRRGGASHAFNSGMRPEYIKLMGDWASDAFWGYVVSNMDLWVQASVKFMENMH